MYGYIYLTENLINGKCYIGKKVSKYFKKNYKGSGKLIKLAFRKYGWDNFVCQPIERCESSSQLNEREKYWIDKCNAVKNDGFYNLQEGGQGGGHPGMKQTDYQKQRIKQLNTGRKHTITEKKLMKENHANFKGGNHPLAKKIICVNTGKVYNCINEAAKDTGIDRHKISNSCKGINTRGHNHLKPSELEFIFYKEVN